MVGELLEQKEFVKAGKASSSFQEQTDYDVILRESVKTQQMVDDERRERHAYFVKLEEKEKEYKIMPMNTTSFTPETKVYWKGKRREIQQKQLAKNLFENSANLDVDNNFKPLN